MKETFSIRGKLVDLFNNRIFPASITVEGTRISTIMPLPEETEDLPYLLPGFVDAHVHIESSMLIPSEFARLAVVHGTVATISDPHEIANVCGLEGIDYMIDNGDKVPFKFHFGAPSCVPATSFETAGASIDAADVAGLLRRDDIWYLSEMMNFPGVLSGDAEIKEKIEAAKRFGKPVDGHAPGLRGDDAHRYIAAGISTDHECFTAAEALDKLKWGMKILIREGSAAKNFEALAPLLHEHSEMMMFCSDDKHPDGLVAHHINALCARAVASGIDVFKVLRAACLNPVLHYKMKVGLLRQNDFADFILVNDLKEFEVLQTYVNGQLVAEGGKTLIASVREEVINRFDCNEKEPAAFRIKSNGGEVPVIEALEGQLITNRLSAKLPTDEEGWLHSDPAADLLKIVVVNRYKEAPAAVSFIKNFGLKRGAIASSVAHDSHNIVAVGVDDESICKAVNAVIRERGGISCAGDTLQVLPLPVGGLMSREDGYEVARQYAEIDAAAKALGSTLSAPYTTLSFMALLVIPKLKLSDLGLFDGEQFKLMNS